MHTVRNLAAAICIGLGISATAGAPSNAVTFGDKSSIAALSVPKDWTLQGVVLLSRHGLRSPLDSRQELNALTVSRWPKYGVRAGQLLPEGYDRAVTLGKFYRRYYTSHGLFSYASGYCPSSEEATFLFDPDERVKETAKALAEGMFPGCDDVVVKGNAPIFDGGDAPACAAPRSEQASRAFIGGSWAKVADGELKKPLALMSTTLGTLKATTCAPLTIKAGTTLSDYHATKTDFGPINCADELSENFLMQYGAGFPEEEVAFGRLGTGKDLAENLKIVNKIHALNFAASYLPAYIARRQSSTLADVIKTQLEKIANDGKAPRFLALVGHDNELLNIGGLLDTSWTLPDYNKNQVPPGGAMVFEVWNTSSGQVVRALYMSQTPDQLRFNERLTFTAPPGAVRLPLKNCGDNPDGVCPLERFADNVDKAIMKECVVETPYNR